MVVRTQHTGRPGRPRSVIDETFLRWAYEQRSTTAIANFLNVDRSTVREALVDYGIASPGTAPFPYHDGTYTGNTLGTTPNPRQLPGYLSDISDRDLDILMFGIKASYRRMGVSMMDGMLRGLGVRVPEKRIRDAMLRIDPVHRLFDRIRIRRRGYEVPGPNALWHHDGQHGECGLDSLCCVGTNHKQCFKSSYDIRSSSMAL